MVRIEGYTSAIIFFVASSSFDGPFTQLVDSNRDPKSSSLSVMDSVKRFSYADLYALIDMSSDPRLPFKFTRRLLPLIISYAMTINKSQQPVPSPGNVRQSAKRKPKVESGEQAFRTSMSPPPGRCEYINIGARQDKLDPSFLEKLPLAVALPATSVHKYWTSSFGKAADTAEVTELMKLAEMYTSRSHVLNCELYKMLEIKVDEIYFVIGEDEDTEAMRAEIKRLRA
ncbi:alpha-L-fucosidase 2 [Forsythia ovata]|uniref:Alpha-L-fucosidase 2 n=1 Tax=Forsythia ovata TaxID=205694 RepID=A0ABD1PZ83_9LAMI